MKVVQSNKKVINIKSLNALTSGRGYLYADGWSFANVELYGQTKFSQFINEQIYADANIYIWTDKMFLFFFSAWLSRFVDVAEARHGYTVSLRCNTAILPETAATAENARRRRGTLPLSLIAAGKKCLAQEEIMMSRTLDGNREFSTSWFCRRRGSVGIV